MLARDLHLVGADEMPVAHDWLAADVEPVDAVRPREDEPGDQVAGAAELESVRPPDCEIGSLAGRQLADVVPAEHRRATARAQAQSVAGGQRLRAATRP